MRDSAHDTRQQNDDNNNNMYGKYNETNERILVLDVIECAAAVAAPMPWKTYWPMHYRQPIRDNRTMAARAISESTGIARQKRK